MRSDQQSSSAGRVFRIQTSTHGAAPTDRVTEPDIVTSPVTPAGYPTQGIMVALMTPIVGTAATPDDSEVGFEVTIWCRNPVTRQWASTEPFNTTGREWFSNFDFDGGDLYVQITPGTVDVAGGIDVHLVEQ